MNWTDQAARQKWDTSQKKLFVLQYTNTDKVKIFCALHDKIALLTRRCSDSGEHEKINSKINTSGTTANSQTDRQTADAN